MRSIGRTFKAALGAGSVLVLVFTIAGHAVAQTWMELSPSGGPPNARSGHTAVYDLTNSRMVVFGGSAGGDEVWVLENANGIVTPNWVQLDPTFDLVLGPPNARFDHTAVYDTTNNRMIVFGGLSGLDVLLPLRDVWVLGNANTNTPNWVRLDAQPDPIVGELPSARSGHTAVYDTANSRMVVFGGLTGGLVGSFPLNDVWVLENANTNTPSWTQLTPAGGPSARSGHTAVYDATTNRMVVFGGAGELGNFNDAWVLTNANGISQLTVDIDIKPGRSPNRIRLDRTRKISVAILSSATFNAPGEVNQGSLTFGRTGAEQSLASCGEEEEEEPEDLNGDGLSDLLCRFRPLTAAFRPGDTQGILKGRTVEGTPFMGTDSVEIVSVRPDDDDDNSDDGDDRDGDDDDDRDGDDDEDRDGDDDDDRDDDDD